MYVHKVLFKCDIDGCGVEQDVDTFNESKTPLDWSCIEVRVNLHTQEVWCKQHLCPHHTARLNAFLSQSAGWHINDVQVDVSPLKPGANPKALPQQ